MKKIFTIVLTLVLSISLAACGSGKKEEATSTVSPVASLAVSATEEPTAAPTPEPAPPAELTYLASVTPNYSLEMYQDLVKKFTDKNPNIKINIIKAPDAKTSDYAKTLLASGNFPDVMNNVGGDNFLEAKAFLEIPIDDDLKQIKGIEQDAYYKDGKNYAIKPYYQAALLIYYNKKLFADAGITELPKTWDQFFEVCKKLKDNKITPLLLGSEFTTSYVFGEMISPSVFGNAQSWYKDRYENKVHFTDDNFVKATDHYIQLVKDGYINKGALSLPYNSMEAEFIKGKIGMYPMGSWAAGSEVLTKSGLDIGVFLPPSDDGKVYAAGDFAGGFTVSATTKFPEAAIKFAKYMALDPEPHKILAQKDSQISNLVTPISYEMTPLQQSVFDALSKADVNIGHYNGKLGGRGATAGSYDAYGKVAQDILQGKTDAKALLKYLDDVWDKDAAKLK